MSLSHLPLINALLNALSALFILAGWHYIRRRSYLEHACCMIIAFITSCLFLTCYLIYHFNIPGHHVPFTTPGWPRLIYFFILFTHLPLALILVPLVVMTFTPALQRRFDRHKKIAKWTLPIWLYVSMTGVLVYCMLYLLYPARPS
ncbi:MAG: DUF420 domain-containing protein [Chthoniobacterales bacterium]|nr:DUF420 domain-containing protein [Chthoniobacterales bacterium]